MKKIFETAPDALSGICLNGITIMSGGFGLCGIPENLITALQVAERIRAGGAGIPGFYTKTGVGTLIAEGKEHKTFDGETYILETGLKADLSIVKAWKGDAEGNLIYKATARNFSPMMAMAGKVTVAEVDEIVPVGSLDPNFIHTPGVFVQRIIEAKCEKRIEQLTIREDSA